MLITLAIIGIVAALTIPSVVSNYQHHEYITRLKKVQTTLAQTITMAKANGVNTSLDHDGNGAIEFADSLNFMEQEQPIIKFIKSNLKISNVNGESLKNISLYNTDGSKYLSKNDFYDFSNNGANYKIMLTDGTFLEFDSLALFYEAGFIIGNYQYAVYTDVNGPFRKPNKIGYDVFGFFVSDTGNVVPMGADVKVKDEYDEGSLKDMCSNNTILRAFCMTYSALSGKNPDGTEYWKGIKYWENIK